MLFNFHGNEAAEASRWPSTLIERRG